MSIERTIATRYLLSRRRLGFVSVISVISIIGITIGVAALIVVLSVFNGFGSLVTSLLVSFDPHLRIERPDRPSAAAYAPMLASLEQDRRVAAYSPFVQGKALVVAKSANRVINIKGLDEQKVTGVSGLRDKLVLGRLRFANERNNGIIIGMALADRLGTVVGDTIAVVSPSGAELATAQGGLPLIRRFVIEGIYESNNKDYDAYYAFVGLPSAQSLFAADSMIDGVEVRLHDIERTDRVAAEWRASLGSQAQILTWYDLHRELYTIMQVERWSAYVIVSLIIAVASFNLLGSLTMTVIEKTRDIGILKSMGFTNRMVRRTFQLQGFYVGMTGTVLGLLIGIGVVIAQQRFHLFPLDPTVYIIDAIPVEIRPMDIVLIALAAVGLSSIAARRPARRAAQLLPAEAIRWE